MESKNTPENHALFLERIEALFDAVIKKHKCKNIVINFSLSMMEKRPTIRKFYIFIRQENWVLKYFRMFRYKKMGYAMASYQTKKGVVMHLSATFCNEPKEKQLLMLNDALEAMSEHQDIFFPFM